MSRRLLMIAYYFPPLGMGGVQRMAKLATYLPDYGYDVTVLTVKPIKYPAYDTTLLEELTHTVQIVRAGSKDPARLLRFLPFSIPIGRSAKKTVKQSVAWPDSKIGWIDSAVTQSRKLLASGDFDIMLSSSPPISSHLVAMKLKRDFDIPWVADFRDIWEMEPPEALYDDAAIVMKSRDLLNDIATLSDGTTAVNESVLTDVLGASTRNAHHRVIAGGYDSKDFENISVVKNPGELNLGYMGTVSSKTPLNPLFESVAKLCETSELTDKSIVFTIIGMAPQKDVISTASQSGMTNVIRFTGYLSHREALAKAMQADILLLSLSSDFKQVLPGKIFDYCGLPAPVLAMVPSGGEADKFIRKYNLGASVPVGDVPSLTEQLKSLIEYVETNKSWPKILDHSVTRQGVAQDFSALFDSLIDG